MTRYGNLSSAVLLREIRKASGRYTASG